ncbi:MAG: PAS domain S-box protein, partial [Nitrospirae bacterium]|nr:PAS domain S-box protein [Nitrospirota bacterium]
PVINTISLSKNSIISHLYPLRGHESVLGLNLMAHPQRRLIVEKTIKNRKGFVAGPIELIEGGTALISYTPIFSAISHGNLKAGAYWGLTDITIMMDRLFKEAGLYYESPTLIIAIRGRDGSGSNGDIFWGDAAVFQSNPVRLDITLPNSSWEMAAIPKGGWASTSPFYLVLWTGGIVLTVAGGMLIWVLVRTLIRLRELVEQATESLSESEKKYRELVENANSMILKIDTDGNITFINEFAQDFFGYKEYEILGRNVIGTIVPTADSYNNDPCGERVWVAWTNKGIYENKMLTGVLCIGNDITMFKKAEQELRKYQHDLEDMVRERTEKLAEANEKLQKVSAYKSEFLASMSHEIRTPMNAIIGMADLLWETELTPEQLQYVQSFRSAGEALLTLINDILDFSKVEAGQLSLEAIDFDLNEVLEKLCEIIAIKAHAKGIKLAYHIMPDVPKYLIGDPHRIRQILVNLIANAIKFTEKGEVVITVGNQKTEDNFVTLNFSVRDTGVGIPQEKLESIFERFTQCDASTTRKYGGTGLGLTISKRLVEMMGGDIWIESKSGKGSIFHFTIKLVVQPENFSIRKAAGESIAIK